MEKRVALEQHTQVYSTSTDTGMLQHFDVCKDEKELGRIGKKGRILFSGVV